MEVSLIFEEVVANLFKFHIRVKRETDALYHEVDGVRAMQIDLSNVLVDLKNHFYSIQSGYVKMEVSKKGVKNLKCFFGFSGCG